MGNGGGRKRLVRLDARALLLLLPALLSIQTLSLAAPSRAARNPLPSGPNVLIIVTDDQRARGTLEVMRQTRRHFLKPDGARYENAFATIPLCCPSRASIFTGQYSHNHGVRNSSNPEKLDHQATVQRYLQEAGYRTSIFGKFLNSWDLSQNPPYFNDWAIFSRSNQTGYYGGEWNVDGIRQVVEDYSTDYIANRAVDFLNRTELIDVQPWYMYLSTAAPHAPYTPEPAYEDAPIEDWSKKRQARRDRLRYKPPWVSDRTLPSSLAEDIRARQLRTLMSVDDLVGDVFETMNELGETRELVAFFLSDNGFLWGEHGLTGNRLGKRYPYTESVKIPFLVRGLPTSADENSIVATIDIAPTVLQTAGIAPDSEYTIDGRSLVSGPERNRILLEYFNESEIPSWASTRTATYQYVEYYGSDDSVIAREYYDLVDDPLQLYNLLGDLDPTNDPDVAALEERLQSDRSCAGTACP